MGIAFLLDTHVFLWAAQEANKLSEQARFAIENIDNRLYLSPVSAYEIGNKYRLGKLPEYEYVINNYSSIAKTLQTIELPINTDQMSYASSMDWQHRDPFDRILAAQAYLNGLQLITSDAAFNELKWLSILWE
jgi:PIN domain nuclease of toxin-antitoxin system